MRLASNADIRLKNVPHTSLNPIHGALLLVLLLEMRNTGTSLIFGDIFATDGVSLVLAHTTVDINFADGDPEGTVFWSDEPAVDLPDKVQEDKQWASKISREETFSCQVFGADWVQCNVELGDERTDGNQDVGICTPDTESCSVRNFFLRMAVGFPAE